MPADLKRVPEGSIANHTTQVVPHTPNSMLVRAIFIPFGRGLLERRFQHCLRGSGGVRTAKIILANPTPYFKFSGNIYSINSTDWTGCRWTNNRIHCKIWSKGRSTGRPTVHGTVHGAVHGPWHRGPWTVLWIVPWTIFLQCILLFVHQQPVQSVLLME